MPTLPQGSRTGYLDAHCARAVGGARLTHPEEDPGSPAAFRPSGWDIACNPKLKGEVQPMCHSTRSQRASKARRTSDPFDATGDKGMGTASAESEPGNTGAHSTGAEARDVPTSWPRADFSARLFARVGLFRTWAFEVRSLAGLRSAVSMAPIEPSSSPEPLAILRRAVPQSQGVAVAFMRVSPRASSGRRVSLWRRSGPGCSHMITSECHSCRGLAGLERRRMACVEFHRRGAVVPSSAGRVLNV